MFPVTIKEAGHKDGNDPADTNDQRVRPYRGNGRSIQIRSETFRRREASCRGEIRSACTRFHTPARRLSSRETVLTYRNSHSRLVRVLFYIAHDRALLTYMSLHRAIHVRSRTIRRGAIPSRKTHPPTSPRPATPRSPCRLNYFSPFLSDAASLKITRHPPAAYIIPAYL